MQKQQITEDRPLLNDVELAAHLGIKVSTLRKWRQTGNGVPWLKINGSLVRYRLADVSAYLESCCKGVVSDGTSGIPDAVDEVGGSRKLEIGERWAR